MKNQDTPSYLDFDIGSYFWQPDIDYKKHPEKYRVGKGEEGVLICEPYKSEIGQHWRFRTEEIAKDSSETIYQLFLNYIKENDFVGADMARKYLQMGYTRARRYANYRGGKKYDKKNNYKQLERGTGEEEKAKAAKIYYEKYKLAEADPIYKKLKTDWKKNFG
ncbi:MAG: DUF4385 domain-containing protein [Pedobacter sp.]|nr:DUF4385 domain-containing protein [Pedobacter sp.]